MGARPTFRVDTEDIDQVFEERLTALGLGLSQIGDQSLAELRESLEQIDAAIAKPEAFGVLNLKFTTGAGTIIAAGSAESHMTYGILPLLLVRKRVIVARIRELEAEVADVLSHDSANGASAEISTAVRRTPPTSRTVFVVHGRDQSGKTEVARLLERLQFDAIILEEHPNRGQTVIEKFQQHALDVAFAVVLMTADDRGAGPGENAPKHPNRARQNVILELGYFMGALGRDRVTALIASGVEQPSDILGIAYIPMDSESWKPLLAQELHAAGLDVDFNLLYRSS